MAEKKHRMFIFERMPLQNDILLRAAKGELTERSPVWLMRQAGRSLPEYRAVRERAGSFRNLVETPELAAEVTVQPVDILGVDAAIIFSDILVVADVLGFRYRMEPGKGPVFDRTLSNDPRIPGGEPDVEGELAYVGDSIRKSKELLEDRVPLIGFAGAPWTLFSYLAEGGGSKDFPKARKLLYQKPDLAREMLDRIVEATLRYLRMQIQAGADIVQIFDSWAGVLGKDMYRIFGLEPLKRVCEGIDEVPVIAFAKGADHSLEELDELPCDVIGLDQTMEVERSKGRIASGRPLQGNLDPAFLYASPERIREGTEEMLEAFSGRPHIANLGHGVLPDSDPEHIKAFVDTVKEHQPYEKL